MTFEDLLSVVSVENPPGVRIDSRLVRPGDIFVALGGTSRDGRNFINDALVRGARYIVTKDPPQAGAASTINVGNPAEAAALLAHAARKNPASNFTNLAVTGTNGKTTVAFLTRSVIKAAGEKAGLIGTVVYDTGDKTVVPSLTTPDCVTVAELAEQMYRAGCRYMIAEASSHALVQQRLAGIEFQAAAFTNLSSDHLDYHKSRRDYLEAKSILFENLGPTATAVLNYESAEAREIAGNSGGKILWYAVDRPCDIRAEIEGMDIAGTTFMLQYGGRSQRVKTPLVGLYNVSNHLAAAGLCIAAGFDLETIAKGLGSLDVIPGRLEKVPNCHGFTVIIDYAHTDDALDKVLRTLKPLCTGRLIVVFGCGGDRDRTKRPRMARVVEKFADRIVVTSDNPRSEEPKAIIEEITAGFKKPDSQAIENEIDRKNAIALAINFAGTGDIVLIAGKGHEDYQIIKDKKFHFSDKEVAREFLDSR